MIWSRICAGKYNPRSIFSGNRNYIFGGIRRISLFLLLLALALLAACKPSRSSSSPA